MYLFAGTYHTYMYDFDLIRFVLLCIEIMILKYIACKSSIVLASVLSSLAICGQSCETTRVQD